MGKKKNYIRDLDNNPWYMIAGNVEGDIGSCIIFGHGPHVKGMIDRLRSDDPIIIMDPHLFSREMPDNVIQASYPHEIIDLSSCIYNRSHSECIIVAPMQSVSLFGEEMFIEFMDSAQRSRQIMETNKNTMKRLPEWVKNAKANVEKYGSGVSENRFTDIVSGKSCVIVGAGPSLRDSVKYLKEISDNPRYVICVTNRAIRFLHENGVRGDIEVVAEDLDMSDNFVDDSVLRLCSITGNPLNVNDNTVFISPSAPVVRKPLIPVLKGTSIKTLNTGISASTMITIACCKHGCEEIVFVGQDLCYQGGKYVGSDDLPTEEHCTVETIDGKTAMTSHGYWQAARSLFNISKSFKGVRFVNNTASGMKLEFYKEEAISHGNDDR